MRLDVRDADSQFEAMRHRCFLDGVDISMDCFAADDVEGWADCYVRGADGLCIPLPGGELKEERRRGTVEFMPVEGVPA